MNKLNDTNSVVTYSIDGNEIKLSPSIVRDFIVGDQNINITDQEYKMFVELCKVRGLNPFLKEVYCIKYSNRQPAQIVVGKDAILKRAIVHPDYNGREQGVIVLKEDGTIEERKGTFKLPDEKLVGGWAKVYRKNWEHPTYISVSFEETAQYKNLYDPNTKKVVGQELNSQWKTKGATMIEKVALVRALRETFIEEIGGMIDQDEAWNNQNMSVSRENNEEIIEQNEPIIQEDVIDVKEVSFDEL